MLQYFREAHSGKKRQSFNIASGRGILPSTPDLSIVLKAWIPISHVVGHKKRKGEGALLEYYDQEGHCSLCLCQGQCAEGEPWQGACAEQLLCLAGGCAPSRTAEKPEKRTIKLRQQLDMILHREREPFLLQLLRRVRWLDLVQQPSGGINVKRRF